MGAAAGEEGYCVADDGVRLWYSVEGSGLPLVLGHGGPGLWDGLGALAAPLAERCTVIRWEQRGSGRSDTAGPYTVARFVADHDQLRQHLGFDRWVVGGHSWGASLALQSVLADPDVALGLLYVSGVGVGRAWHAAYRAEAGRRLTEEQRKHLAELTGRPRTAEEEIRYRALSWAPDFADRDQALDLAEAEARVPFPISVEANAAINAETATWDEAELLDRCRRLDVPALVLHGEADPRPVWAVEPLADALPHGRLVVLPNAGHLPWVEAPEATADAITSFLKSIPFDGWPHRA